MTDNTVPADRVEVAPEPPRPPAADTEARFFLWLRSLGIVRDDGWLGGVCGAIAQRTGVDPLIVRGIVVVVTVLGFPALWLYAIAWALLPDRAGRIPLQMRSGSGPGLAGVALTIVAALVTTWAGNSFIELVATVAYPGRWVWSFVEASLWFAGIGAVAAILILFLRRRSARLELPHTGVDGAVSGTAAVSGGAAVFVGNGAAPPSHLPEPVEPLADALASAEELDVWRAQHAAWREQHDAWRRAQTDGSAAAEERARRQAEYAAFRAEARRVRAEARAMRPRTSIAFVTITIGAAVVAATGVWLVFQPQAEERSVQAAVLAAAAVTAVAMIVAGALRRRSGFLAAITMILLLIGGSGLATYLVDDMIGPDRYVPMPDGDQDLAQPWGQLTLDVGGPYDESGVTRIEKGTGTVWITVNPGVDVEFETTSETGGVLVENYSDDGQFLDQEAVDAQGGRFTWSHDDPRTSRTRTIILDQSEVDVHIQTWGVQK